jgi:NAD(P)-dependent dehydrogenase (short-subunit alcohol dehydrogenase family)
VHRRNRASGAAEVVEQISAAGGRCAAVAVADGDRLTHIARPEEVAAVIAYLAGEQSWLVTGNVIRLR